VAGFYRIEQEGEETYQLADSYEYYYRLGEREVLRARWEIGLCLNCKFIFWVEELRAYTAENSIAAFIPMRTKEGDPGYEIEKECHEEELAYEARFNRFLESRTSPPRCRICFGTNVTNFGETKLSEWIEHPIKKRLFRIVADGCGVTASHLERKYTFLSPEGEPLELSEEERKVLTEVVEESRR
jgi:hypothetical protein